MEVLGLWFKLLLTILVNVSLILELFVGLFGSSPRRTVVCQDVDDGDTPKVNIDLGADKEGSRTDDGVVQREEEAIRLDGLNVSQMKELRDKAEKFQFQVWLRSSVKTGMILVIN